jgi:hypothetical protein
MAPDWTLAMSLFVEARLRSGRLRPQLRVALARTLTDRAQSGPVTANFAVTFTEIDLCPATLWLATWAELAPCAGMQAGVLAAEGVALSPSRSESRPWLAPLVALRGTLALRHGLFAQLEAGAGFPLVRDRFAVDPGVPVWQTATTLYLAGAAVGMTFR